MFGISPLGWLHTLGSLPAIPMAIYMLARFGRIVPRSTAGAVYLVSMLIGTLSLFLFAKEPVSYGIAIATLLLLAVGYSVGRVPVLGRIGVYLETISLTLSVFLLFVPSAVETLTRIPDGHPIVADRSNSPLLSGVLASLLVLLVIGLVAQVIWLRRKGRNVAHIA